MRIVSEDQLKVEDQKREVAKLVRFIDYWTREFSDIQRRKLDGDEPFRHSKVNT